MQGQARQTGAVISCMGLKTWLAVHASHLMYPPSSSLTCYYLWLSCGDARMQYVVILYSKTQLRIHCYLEREDTFSIDSFEGLEFKSTKMRRKIPLRLPRGLHCSQLMLFWKFCNVWPPKKAMYFCLCFKALSLVYMAVFISPYSRWLFTGMESGHCEQLMFAYV